MNHSEREEREKWNVQLWRRVGPLRLVRSSCDSILRYSLKHLKLFEDRKIAKDLEWSTQGNHALRDLARLAAQTKHSSFISPLFFHFHRIMRLNKFHSILMAIAASCPIGHRCWSEMPKACMKWSPRDPFGDLSVRFFVKSHRRASKCSSCFDSRILRGMHR